MKRFVVFVVVSIFLSSSLYVAPAVYAGQTPRPILNARSAIILDARTNEIIYQKNSTTKRAPASLTKIMSVLVAIDHMKLSDEVCVSRKASLAQPSKVYIRAGECYTVKDLIYAMMLNSGNDAAICLAEAVAGSEWKFVQLMNQKARNIGAYNTRFINASGLPGKGQYSTARDLAKIMAYAAKNPFVRGVMGRKVYTIKLSNGRHIRLRNHNKLLWKYTKKVIGKTGYTRAAGRCFLGYAKYGKREVVICVLNSRTMWGDSRRLLDYVFGRDNKQIISINKKMHSKHEVKRIQRALRSAGYNPGKIDGIFGYKTLDAVFQFQRSLGLKVDGIVGPQTLGKLKQFL